MGGLAIALLGCYGLIRAWRLARSLVGSGA